MADETQTVILNPRPIEAPEPPKPGLMGGEAGKFQVKSAETALEALQRRLAALEKAVNESIKTINFRDQGGEVGHG